MDLAGIEPASQNTSNKTSTRVADIFNSYFINAYSASLYKAQFDYSRHLFFEQENK